MDPTMRAIEHEKRDWSVIALILLFGLLGILLAGGWALRFTPSWELDANVESRLDPDSDFLTRKPEGFIEPVDPAILTNPAWIDSFLTPDASFSTATPHATTIGESFTTPTTGTSVTTQTTVSTTTALATNTALALPSPTNTFVYYPPIPSSTPKPKPATATSVMDSPTPASIFTGVATFTATPTASATPSPTFTPTATDTPIASSTPTATATPSQTATPTPTGTTDPTEPDFGGPDGNTILLGNGAWVEFNLSGFLLDGDPAWDVVYYEKEETSSAGKVHLGAVLIEVYDETTAAWYVIYNWGDGVADANASYSNAPEPDGFPVDMGPLYGAPPWNTGIAIDIDSAAIGQGGAIGDSITKIRITSLSSNDCDIDSLQMLR
jgi:hypothetical protein